MKATMMMNLTTKQPPLAAGGPRQQQQLERNQLLNSSTKIKNVITSLSTQPPCSQSQNNLHLSNSNYPLGLMPLATQIAGHGSEGKSMNSYSILVLELSNQIQFVYKETDLHKFWLRKCTRLALFPIYKKLVRSQVFLGTHLRRTNTKEVMKD